MGRVEEGRGVGQWFLRHGHAGRVLDISAGNGGVSIGMANFAAFDVTAADIVINQDLFSLRRDVPLPVTQVAANGHNLPFRSATFDIILCLDTVEHVPQPELLAAEIMRVLRRGGLCMITTPARLRHLFGRDPHYGIPGLLLLPDRLQRAVGSFLLGRTTSYDVEHIFWSVCGTATGIGGGIESSSERNDEATTPSARIRPGSPTRPLQAAEIGG